jgi:short-subunit dehydrogenase
MLAVTGYNTTIIKALAVLAGEQVTRIESDVDVPIVGARYVLAAGVLIGKHPAEQTIGELMESAWVNLMRPIRLCERILVTTSDARICVVGSHSAIAGSFDRAYAASKAGLHQYVLTRGTGSTQQLFCVAPTIISDSGMTARRHDYPAVLKKRRTVTAEQVALAIYRHLYDPNPNPLTNAVVPVT